MTDKDQLVIYDGRQPGYRSAIINGQAVKIDKLTRYTDRPGIEPEWLMVSNTGETYYLTDGHFRCLADGVLEWRASPPVDNS